MSCRFFQMRSMQRSMVDTGGLSFLCTDMGMPPAQGYCCCTFQASRRLVTAFEQCWAVGVACQGIRQLLGDVLARWTASEVVSSHPSAGLCQDLG